jgi:hypothetical protein
MAYRSVRHWSMKANPRGPKALWPQRRNGSKSFCGIWDSNGLRIDMGNIAQHRNRASAAAASSDRSRRQVRRRKRTASGIAAGGRLVTIRVGNKRKRTKLAEVSPAITRFTSPENGRKPVPFSLRSLEQAWMSQHQAEYAGAWVALDGSRLLAHGSSARQVLDAARSAGCEQPLVVHIPREPQLPFGGW